MALQTWQDVGLDPISRNPALGFVYSIRMLLLQDILLPHVPLKYYYCGAKTRLTSDNQTDLCHRPWTRANKSKFRRQQDMYTVADEIVVPDNKDKKAQIIFLHHATPYVGHRGRKKTLGAIEQTFWWP